MSLPRRPLALALALSVAPALAPLACSSSSGPATPADSGADTTPAVPTTCARGAKATAIPKTCNGSEALCARRFDRVTFPMTHNAMSNADDGWLAPNQDHGLARQLADGVRGFMLDTHYYDEETGYTDQRRDDLAAIDQAYLCHGVCALGRRRLLEGLCDLTSFLDQHRGEVVSIIFEDYVTPEDTAAVMQASGLVDYVHVQPLGAPWPTLRELIDGNERLIVFSESGRAGAPWYHPAWKHIWDTPYTFRSTADFTCARNRGDETNALFLVNHWLQSDAGLPDPALGGQANASAVLAPRVQQCANGAGRPPTFVGVDYYDVGALFEVVRASNGL